MTFKFCVSVAFSSKQFLSNNKNISSVFNINSRRIFSSSNVFFNQVETCHEPLPPCPPPKKKKTWVIIAGLATLGSLGFVYFKKRKVEITKEPIIDSMIKQRVPLCSSDIPKEVPYLLIGGGTASFSAFRAIKSHDPKAKVLVITNELEMPYMRPPLSKEMWFDVGNNSDNNFRFKQWNGVERSIFYEPEHFYIDPTKLLDSTNGGVSVVRGYTVQKVDPCKRTCTLFDGTVINYQKCLIATGSQPKKLAVFENVSLPIRDKISTYKTVEDFTRLKQIVKNKKSVAIIGGGFLGSELACALSQLKEGKVFQILHEKGNMAKILPEYLSITTTKKMVEEGVNILKESQVINVEQFGQQVILRLIDGKSIVVDHIVVAVGFEPDVSLAKASGLEVDTDLNGYVVNAELQARTNLYVAGDAAAFYDPKLGRRRVEHHDHAVVSGRLAGENMAGLNKPYKHQSMFWSDLGSKIGYEAIGLVDSKLSTVAVYAKSQENEPISLSQKDLVTMANSADCEAIQKINSDDISCNDTADSFNKGVVFYLRDDIIVGIVLWNIFNRINIARQIINEGKKFDDLNEVAKLFKIHT